MKKKLLLYRNEHTKNYHYIYSLKFFYSSIYYEKLLVFNRSIELIFKIIQSKITYFLWLTLRLKIH